MSKARNLSDEELIDLAHHWRRLALQGDASAKMEASRHETELRQRLGEASRVPSDGPPANRRDTPPEPDVTSALSEITSNFLIATADASTQSDGALRDLLHNLRVLLQMDIAFVAEFVDGHKVFRQIDRAAGSTAAVAVGDAAPLEQTLCQRVVDGRMPSLLADASSRPELADVAAAKVMNIGAYLSTPVVLRDGRVYGTLCCISHAPRSALGNRQIDALRHVAGIVATELDKRRQPYETTFLAC
jgi:GAF domain-containing protein